MIKSWRAWTIRLSSLNQLVLMGLQIHHRCKISEVRSILNLHRLLRCFSTRDCWLYRTFFGNCQMFTDDSSFTVLMTCFINELCWSRWAQAQHDRLNYSLSVRNQDGGLVFMRILCNHFLSNWLQYRKHFFSYKIGDFRGNQTCFRLFILRDRGSSNALRL